METKAVFNVEAIAPGRPFKLGMYFTLEPHWHIYGPQKTELGLPTTLNFDLPEGFTTGPLHYPETSPFLLPLGEKVLQSYGYEGEVLIWTEITPPDSLTEESYEFGVSARWLVCKNDGQCIPGNARKTITLIAGDISPSEHATLFEKFAAAQPYDPNTTSTESSPPAESAVPAAPSPDSLFPFLTEIEHVGGDNESRGLVAILLFAFIGGLILNIMPCVLPVLSIKVLGFVNQAGEDRKRGFFLGLMFAAGVMASFLVLATVVVAMKQAGAEVGWGFQMSNPHFLLIISAIVFAFGLSLFGVFSIELPGSAMAAAGKLQGREGAPGAFFNGVLATVLATPCSAPFLGPAVGFAFTQTAGSVYLVFLFVGFGLAAPYLLLSTFPRLLAFVPKPGPWMETFKQSMGFLLMGTVVFLLYVLGTIQSAQGVIGGLAFLTLVAIACWLIGKGYGYNSSRARKAMVAAMALALTAGGYYFLAVNPSQAKTTARSADGLTGNDQIDWQPFSIERVEELVAEGRTVFVDFTASWCLTCKANEYAVLARDDVRDAFERENVATLKGDYTRQPPEITAVLNFFERAGVPLYVIFPANNPDRAIVLPEALTPGMVIDWIEKSNGRDIAADGAR